ncbi:MAG: hypothetical protein AAGC57_19575 [Pseudomonadota bacterium]
MQAADPKEIKSFAIETQKELKSALMDIKNLGVDEKIKKPLLDAVAKKESEIMRNIVDLTRNSSADVMKRISIGLDEVERLMDSAETKAIKTAKKGKNEVEKTFKKGLSKAKTGVKKLKKGISKLF